MRFMLDRPDRKWSGSYFSAVENTHNPPYEAVKDTKGCKLGLSKPLMGQAEDSTPQLRQLTELKRTKEKHPCQKTWESTVENGQEAKQRQRSSFY